MRKASHWLMDCVFFSCMVVYKFDFFNIAPKLVPEIDNEGCRNHDEQSIHKKW